MSRGGPKSVPVEQRLAGRLVVDPETQCHNWTGPPLHNGYGHIAIGPRVNGNLKRVRVHRMAWELKNGPIPEGMQVDHLCRNRACCNVDHLELVTPAENVRRGNSPSAISARTGVCQKGHPMTEDNVYTPIGKGGRSCRRCRREYNSKRSERKRSMLNQLRKEVEG